MKSLFEITTSNGQVWYDLFYFLAIVVAGARTASPKKFIDDEHEFAIGHR